MVIQALARLVKNPGVKINLFIERVNSTSEEEEVYRTLVVVSCAHAGAREALKAKNLKPIILSGPVEKIEMDIAQGGILSRIQEAVKYAEEAEEKDAEKKKDESVKKSAKPKAEKPKEKTPEELKEIGRKATGQTSLMDEDQKAEAPAAETPEKEPVQPRPTQRKEAQKFLDLIDELEMAVSGGSRKIAMEKIELINATGKVLKDSGGFQKGSPELLAMVRYRPKSGDGLYHKAQELTEESDKIVQEDEEQPEMSFE